jgi:hypothetical protein
LKMLYHLELIDDVSHFKQTLQLFLAIVGCRQRFHVGISFMKIPEVSCLKCGL